MYTHNWMNIKTTLKSVRPGNKGKGFSFVSSEQQFKGIKSRIHVEIYLVKTLLSIRAYIKLKENKVDSDSFLKGCAVKA